MKKYLLFIPLLVLSTLVDAQNKNQPPILFETLFGNDRVAMAMGFNKPIAGKFRYVNITSTAAYYDYKKGATELVSVNSFNYQLHKHVALSGGMQYHFVKGFIPNAAVYFSYVNPVWYLTLTPYYNFMPWNTIETSAVAEFKPKLSEQLRLFTRFQGFYGFNLDASEFERGMMYMRLGLTHKFYTGGFGANLDYYQVRGNLIEKQNYGLFLRIDI